MGPWGSCNAQEPSDQQPLSTHSYGDFQACGRQRKTRTFICKPDSGSQGRGIFITRNPRDIKPGEHMICQQYISKVKGASGPPGPSATTGLSGVSQSQGGSQFQAPTLSAIPILSEGIWSPHSEPAYLGLNLSFSPF